jgi:hypothetical protein
MAEGRQMASVFLILGLILAISTTSIISVAGQSSASSAPVTFYSIYVGGAPDFKTNVTKTVLNGSESQIDEQLKSLIQEEYKELNESTAKGPVIFLGKTPGETIVKQNMTQAEFLNYYRDLLKQSSNETFGGPPPLPRELCWFWFLGGGSMHDLDCADLKKKTTS